MIPYMATSDVEELEVAFGARIRQVRIAAGVSQVELARLANVSRSAISNLESGAGSSLATVIKVLRALDRSDWLLSLQTPAEVFNPLDLLHSRAPGRRTGPPRVSRPRTTASGAGQG